MKIIHPDILLDAYSKGLFPMGDSRDSEEIEWYSASERGIIPIDKFYASNNLRRLVKKQTFEVKIDTQFRQVVEGCADREDTWINDLIIDTFEHMHQLGHAHSVEVYHEGKLVGGVYGIHYKAAFFAESMFKYYPEADKVAMFYLHHILEKNGFKLWDAQYYTEHLGKTFGCIEISGDEYLLLLEEALKTECEFKI
jgi:leucyl/phenylalanyl-tRNA--protein transferase